MQNIPLHIQHTLDFVTSTLPEKKMKILEVGCGKGDLAVELKNEGYFITAIDLSPEAVEEAKTKDIDARVADIADFQSEEAFDCVLFTHSLHHIHPLDGALKKAKSLLNQKGRVMIEDFSHDLVDEKTAKWFYEMGDLVSLLTGRGVEAAEERAKEPLVRWKESHHHQPALHTSKDLLKGLERNFETNYTTTVPYLFRYFVKKTLGLENADEVVRKMHEWESKGIQSATLQPIGLRIIAKKHFSYLR